MARTKGPSPIDAHVGSRMRMRRMMLGMSQEKLADGFGITFQQVQKYEKGTNRMGASRLQQRSKHSRRASIVLFRGSNRCPYVPDGSAPSPSYIDEFVTSHDGLRLAKAFMRVRPAL